MEIELRYIIAITRCKQFAQHRRKWWFLARRKRKNKEQIVTGNDTKKRYYEFPRSKIRSNWFFPLGSYDVIQDRASALRANNPEKPDSWRPGKINDVSARRRLRPCKIYLCITDTSTNDYVHTDAAVSQDGARLFLQRESTRHFDALTLKSVCESDFETKSRSFERARQYQRSVSNDTLRE